MPSTVIKTVPPIRINRNPNSRLLREFVAGGAPTWYSNRQAIATTPDDLTQEFGLEIYEKMLLDSQVSACVTFWKAAILEEGVEFTPAVNDPKEDGYDQSRAFVDEARKMFDELPVPLDDIMWDMLNAICFGNKVAELVYEIRNNRLDLARIKVKPSRAVAIVVDQYFNTIGFLGAKEGQEVVYPSPMLRAEDILPLEKFAMLTFRPRDADPRGTSILRGAYSPWWRKVTLMPDYVKFLVQFAGPSVLGFTPEDASMEVDPEVDNEEGIATITPEQAMLVTLQAWRNGSAAAFPGGSKVDVIKSEGDGKAFISSFAMSNLEITKAILTQELATEQGEYMARAAAQVHQDVLGTLIRQGKRAVVRTMYKQVLRRWVNYNWGDKFLPLTPLPSLGTVEQEDMSTLMTAIAALMRASYFMPEQLPEIDKLLGFPVRSKTALEVEDETAAEEKPNEDNVKDKKRSASSDESEGDDNDAE